MEVLTEAPEIGSFIPLIEHQSQTPASFHSGPPVLHYFSDRCKVIVLEQELAHAPALSDLVSKASQPAHTNDPATEEITNGTGAHQAQKTIEDVDVWVTSENLLLYSSPATTGLKISYRAISIHAIQTSPTPDPSDPTQSSQSLYMQVLPTLDPPQNTSNGDDDDEAPETVSLTIIPTASAPPPSFSTTTTAEDTNADADPDDPIAHEDEKQLTPVQALYNALSDCSDLHPDPVEEEQMDVTAGGGGGGEEGQGMSRLLASGLVTQGSGDGGLPPPMPGSGGWITAENMHEFVDEDGNFREDGVENGGGGDDEDDLGPGAGTVRVRREDGADGEDTKWQRTS